MAVPIGFQEKGVAEIADYPMNWDDALESGEGIATSAWVVPDGLTKDSDGIYGLLAVPWFSGGVLGVAYICVNTIVTDNPTPRTFVRSLLLTIVPR